MLTSNLSIHLSSAFTSFPKKLSVCFIITNGGTLCLNWNILIKISLRKKKRNTSYYMHIYTIYKILFPYLLHCYICFSNFGITEFPTFLRFLHNKVAAFSNIYLWAWQCVCQVCTSQKVTFSWTISTYVSPPHNLVLGRV